jgi:exonuclease III
MRIATWNLNTWINRKNGIDNSTLWNWADDNLAADLVIFTEAATPPPPAVRAQGWNVVHRPGGFPNRSSWGTLIAGRNMRVEHLTHVGKKKYELDTKFPGSLTAADVWVNDEYFACVVGMYLPYRKDANKDFIGHPTSDLAELKDDFKNLLDHCDGQLIVAGDLNDIHYRQIPKPLNKLGLVDPFKNYDHVTFRQDWDQEGIFLMDYIYVASELADRITAFSGGIDDFPDSMKISDHAPLLIEMNV